MATPAKAFEMPSEDTKAPEKKKKLAPVIPIRPLEAPEAEKSAPEKGESVFVAYQKKFGGYPAKETYMTNARVYADVAKIKLSDDVLRLYAVLRDYHNTPGVPNKLAAMSDPELLAEVLRMKGEGTAMEQLTSAPALQHIFKKE